MALYRDSSGLMFCSLEGLATFRVNNPSPFVVRLFTVSTNGGMEWRNPVKFERQGLAAAFKAIAKA